MSRTRLAPRDVRTANFAAAPVRAEANWRDSQTMSRIKANAHHSTINERRSLR